VNKGNPFGNAINHKGRAGQTLWEGGRIRPEQGSTWASHSSDDGLYSSPRVAPLGSQLDSSVYTVIFIPIGTLGSLTPVPFSLQGPVVESLCCYCLCRGRDHPDGAEVPGPGLPLLRKRHGRHRQGRYGRTVGTQTSARGMQPGISHLPTDRTEGLFGRCCRVE
jgi:hypothetical protein